MKYHHLNDFIGVPIRRQYFNFPIYILLSILLLAIETVTFIPLFEGDFIFNKWLDDVFVSVFTITISIAPCVILSVLNRYFFGKIVCVLNEEGIHHKDGTIKWNDISYIKYAIPQIGRTSFQPAHIDVVCKNTMIQIESVPLFMLSAVKKFKEDIQTRYDKTIWVFVTTIIITPIIIPALIC